MSNKDKAALLPKLRFPEFRGALGWKETRLGQLGELVSGLTYSPNDVRETGLLVLRSSNVQNGKIALDDCVYVDPATKGANLSQANDILICVRNGSAALIGKNALIPEGMPLCTHGAFMTVFRSKSAKFVFQLFQSDKYQKQVAGDLGATINSINGGQLVKYTFAVPQPSEQQKVADCLSSLDELIAAQSRKVDALKTHKKGLMQQLFPREGETQPRLRFPEFRNAEAWKEMRLGQMGELVSGLTYSPEDVRDNGLLVLRSSNVQEGKICLSDCVYVDPNVKGANLSAPHDILICVRNGSTALIGKNALIPEGVPLCTHGAFMTVFRSKLPKFVFQLLRTEKYQKQVAGDLGATINSINGSQLVKYKFMVPKPEEQEKIAVLLSSIDELIAAQATGLERLKLHKRGLMQQLFVNTEGVDF
jgi:type I restriction enzyme, S subunit